MASFEGSSNIKGGRGGSNTHGLDDARFYQTFML